MNVLLKLLDDSNRDVFPKMPGLWARTNGRWTRFTRATLANPYCGPSRNSIMTGRHSKSTGVINHGDTGIATIPPFEDANYRHMIHAWLSDRGVLIGHTGKYNNGFPWTKGDSYIPYGMHGGGFAPQLDDSGLGGLHNGAFPHQPAYVNYALGKDGVVTNLGSLDPHTTTGANASGRTNSAVAYFSDKITFLLKEFIDLAGSRPWFYTASERATHGAITLPTRHDVPFSIAAADVHLKPSFNMADGADWNTMPAWVRAKPWLNPSVPADQAVIDEHKTDQRIAWRAVQSVDESLLDTMAYLELVGELDNTVIILMSDNGWQRYERRLSKKNTVYDESIGTEIWVRHPDAPLQNRDSTALVQNVDVCAFIAEVMGARPTRLMGGQSFLRNVLTGDDSGWRTSAFVESYEVDARGCPAFEGVVTDQFTYAELSAFGAFPAENELYDRVAHPYQTRNVVNDSGYASVVTDMQNRLAILRKAASL